jgi:hypothetical protein
MVDREERFDAGDTARWTVQRGLRHFRFVGDAKRLGCMEKRITGTFGVKGEEHVRQTDLLLFLGSVFQHKASMGTRGGTEAKLGRGAFIHTRTWLIVTWRIGMAPGFCSSIYTGVFTIRISAFWARR